MNLAVYCRVSTPGQEKDGTSFEEQKRRGEAFANEHGFTAFLYSDVDSGKLGTRGDYRAMLLALESKGVQALWMIDEDRFARDQEFGAQLIKLLIRNDIKLFIGGIERDPTDDSIRAMLGMKFVFAELEHAKIKKRLLSGKILKTNLGHRRSHSTFGFDHVYDEKGQGWNRVNEEESGVVKLAFDLYLKLGSFQAVARELNLRRLLTKKKSTWKNNRVKELLTKPEYKKMVWNYRKTEMLDASFVDGPIVDPMTWDAVQKEIKLHERKVTDQRRVQHAVSGILFCGMCGSPYYYWRDAEHGYERYKHQTTTAVARACRVAPKYIGLVGTESIFSFCFNLLFVFPNETYAFIEAEKMKSLEEREGLSFAEKEVQKQILDSSRTIEKLVDALERAGGDSEGIEERLKKREAEKKALQNELLAIKRGLAQTFEDFETEFLLWTESTLHTFNFEDDNTKRIIYTHFVESATILNRVLRIVFRNKKEFKIGIPSHNGTSYKIEMLFQGRLQEEFIADTDSKELYFGDYPAGHDPFQKDALENERASIRQAWNRHL